MREIYGFGVAVALAAGLASGRSEGWTQRTIYKEPSRDDAAHIARAEEKRRRKAEKLRRLSAPEGGQPDD